MTRKKKNSLRELMSGGRDWADFQSAQNETDRAFAIIEHSVLEDHLTLAIQSKFVKLTEQEDADLFRGTSPLATFSAKVRIGYALGLYDAFIRSDLERVNNIRNACAHSRKTITFDTPEIRAELEKLWVWRDDPDTFEVTGREIFEASLVRIVNRFAVDNLDFRVNYARESHMRIKMKLSKLMLMKSRPVGDDLG